MISSLSLRKICQEAVSTMSPVRFNNRRMGEPTFGEGDEANLLAFMQKSKRDGWYLPLIWLLPFQPVEMEWGVMLEADVTFNICTRELRQQLPDYEREELAFDQILRPVWEDFYRAMENTNQVTFVEGTFSPGKLTNVQAGADLWDVLPVSITIMYSNKYHCLKA